MSNLLAQDPVYISLADFRDTTTNASLKSSLTVSDDALKAIIYNAQVVIDDYIRHYGKPFESDQDWIFPVDVEGVSTIPNDIAIATVYVGELVYTKTSDIRGTVKSEKSGPDSVEYWDRLGYGIYINDKTKRLLDRYRSDFYRAVL